MSNKLNVADVFAKEEAKKCFEIWLEVPIIKETIDTLFFNKEDVITFKTLLEDAYLTGFGVGRVFTIVDTLTRLKKNENPGEDSKG